MSGVQRKLSALLAGLGLPAPELDVAGLALDSRQVASGDLFLALAGRLTHGLAHLDQALARGASAVLWEPAPGIAEPDCEIPQIAVPGLSARVGEIAARFQGQPSQALFVAGITGTDGKTSTAHLATQALDGLGLPCAYAGTLGIGRLGRLHSASHTTADPVAVQQFLADSRDQGGRAVAMEVSSHALDQARVAGTRFSVAVLTNLGRDHLDYHGTVEAYAAAKRRLFFDCAPAAALLNRDDAHGARWAAERLAAGLDTTVYGLDGLDGALPVAGRYLLGRDLQLHGSGLSLEVDSSWGRFRIASRLLGRFNAYNLLAAAGVLLHQGQSADTVGRALSAVATVPGRIEGFQGPDARALLVVDYAHTPQALEQVLGALRAHTRGRLWCVFGCGGDRDRGKRPLMGAAAARLADALIVTDDNPRSEDPAAIVAEVLAGLAGLAARPVRVIHDRAQAVRTAVAAAGPDDVVLIAGKGHEELQIYGSEKRAFSDRVLAAQLAGCEVRA